MQFDIEDKILRSNVAPSAHQHRVRHGVEGGIDFHHGEMLRVPTEPICRPHLFWYPKKMRPADRLGWYAQHFTMVEVNSTFYSVPDPMLVRRWCDVTPQDFVFNIKLHQLLSQDRKSVV